MRAKGNNVILRFIRGSGLSRVQKTFVLNFRPLGFEGEHLGNFPDMFVSL